MTKHIMECWEALELLEGIDVGAIDATDALAVEAQRHQAQCPSCRDVANDRLTWNARLSEAMTAVAVPADLESRLVNRLGPLSPTAVTTETAKPSRRTWLAVLGTIAALVVIAVVWQTWPSPMEIVDRALIDKNIGCELAALPPYMPTQWTPELPEAWRSVFRLRPEFVHEFPPGREQASSVAALVPFEFRAGTAAEPIRGRLVIVPRSQFVDPPENNDFFTAQVQYVPGYSHCLWTEGDWVYLCYVRTGGPDLLELRRLMSASRNFT